MFSVLGEALAIGLAAVPAIVKVEQASSNPALSPVLAICLFLSGAIGVLLTRHNTGPEHPPAGGDAPSTPAAQQQRDDGRPQGSVIAEEHGATISATAPAASAAVAAPSLRRRPEGNALDFMTRRDSEELLELSLAGAAAAVAPAGRGESSSHTLGAGAGAASGPSAAPRGAKSGHDRNRAEDSSSSSGSTVTGIKDNVGRAAATSTPAAAAAAAARPPSRGTTPPASTPPAKRNQRHYRKGGEVLYIAEGVAQGAIGLVRDPVRGAQADGAKGLVKGIGSGVFGVVLKPVKGVAKAGANAYTGVRIGAAKAGRAVVGGNRSGSSSAPSSASKVRRRRLFSTSTRAVDLHNNAFAARPSRVQNASLSRFQTGSMYMYMCTLNYPAVLYCPKF